LPQDTGYPSYATDEEKHKNKINFPVLCRVYTCRFDNQACIKVCLCCQGRAIYSNSF